MIRYWCVVFFYTFKVHFVPLIPSRSKVLDGHWMFHENAYESSWTLFKLLCCKRGHCEFLSHITIHVILEIHTYSERQGHGVVLLLVLQLAFAIKWDVYSVHPTFNPIKQCNSRKATSVNSCKIFCIPSW